MNHTTHVTTDKENEIDLWDPFGNTEFDPNAVDPFASALEENSSPKLMEGMPNFFSDTQTMEKRHSAYEENQVCHHLLELSKSGQYQACIDLAKKEFPHFSNEPLFTDDVSLTLPLEYMVEFLPLIHWRKEENIPDQRSSYLFRSITMDDVEKVDWFFQQSLETDPGYENLLELAISEKSLNAVNYLLSQRSDWVLRPAIALFWACQNMGDPAMDACIKAVSQQMLPQGIQQEDSNEAVPYHPDVNLDLIGLNQAGSLRLSKQRFLNFLAFTPYVEHLLDTGALTQREALDLTIYSTNLCASLLRGEPLLFNFYHPTPTIAYSTKRAEPYFRQLTLPPVTLENIIQLVDKLLQTFPTLLKKQQMRGMVAALNLTQNPHPTMVEWAKAMPGKNVVIGSVDYPWINSCRGNPSPYVSDCLLVHWKERMPKNLIPSISHARFPETERVDLWLQYCTVTGNPPKNSISNLAKSLLALDFDSPLFLEAHKPGGIFHKEHDHYLEYLRVTRSKHSHHYLLAISHLQEEKSYEL